MSDVQETNYRAFVPVDLESGVVPLSVIKQMEMQIRSDCPKAHSFVVGVMTRQQALAHIPDGLPEDKALVYVVSARGPVPAATLEQQEFPVGTDE